MILRGVLLAAGLVASVQTWAGDPKSRYEMTADGDIEVAPDGQVSDYQLKSKLSPTVTSLIDRAVRHWKFEPVIVDGKAVRAKTSMHLTLIAAPVDADNYTVRVEDLHFGEPQPKTGMVKPPHYPSQLVSAHVGGKVVLNARLDASGKVAEVYPYQTSLDVRTRSEADAERYRGLLEHAAIDAVKTWQYDLSETIDGRPRSDTYVVVPLSFYLVSCTQPCSHKGPETDGVWKGYVPGPIHPVPWSKSVSSVTDQDLAALKDGQALSLDSRLHLKDDVIGKAL